MRPPRTRQCLDTCPIGLKSKALQIAVNGTVDPTTANVVLLETLGGKIVQENTPGNWYSKPDPGGAWTHIAAPVAAPTPVSTGSGSEPSVSETNDHGSLAKNLSQTGIYTVGGDTFVLNSPNAAFVILGAGASQIAFIGASSVLLAGGSGQAIVTADAGRNEFVAGTGTLDVTGGGGKDAYVFHANGGLLRLEDYSIDKGDTLPVAKALQGALQQTSDGQGGTMLSSVLAPPTAWTSAASPPCRPPASFGRRTTRNAPNAASVARDDDEREHKG